MRCFRICGTVARLFATWRQVVALYCPVHMSYSTLPLCGGVCRWSWSTCFTGSSARLLSHCRFFGADRAWSRVLCAHAVQSNHTAFAGAVPAFWQPKRRLCSHLTRSNVKPVLLLIIRALCSHKLFRLLPSDVRVACQVDRVYDWSPARKGESFADTLKRQSESTLSHLHTLVHRKESDPCHRVDPSAFRPNAI